MPLLVTLNGQDRTFEDLTAPAQLDQVIQHMELKADRIAVEHNGVIAPRLSWPEVQVSSGDRLEIVHFVGGGRLQPSSMPFTQPNRAQSSACQPPAAKP